MFTAGGRIASNGARTGRLHIGGSLSSSESRFLLPDSFHGPPVITQPPRKGKALRGQGGLRLAGNFREDWRVLYGRTGGTAGNEGETMRRRFVLQATLTGTTLLAPVILSGQQRVPGGPVAAAPVGIAARPMVVASPAQGMRPPVQGTVAARVVTHPVGGRMHPVTPRNPGRPVGVKGSVHSHPVRTSPGVTSGPVFVQPGFENEDYGVPGLGFDYAHYAAVHPNAGQAHFRTGSVMPFVGGGIFVPTVGYVEPGVAAEPAVEEEQSEIAASPEMAETAPVEQAPAASRTRAKSNSAVVASPEYIFVRRDGTVFFAVAYSWMNGNLQYVTQDGFRKLAPLGTLDLDATVQFNEQRGLSFRPPV